MNTLLKFLAILIVSSPILPEKKKDSYHQIMDVIYEYSDCLKKEKGMILTAYGLHYAGKDKIFDDKIHEIELGYSLDKRMQYNEGRQLFYSIVDGLLSKLNQDKSLKEFFFNSPVTYQDLFFRLSFDYDGKGNLKKGDLYKIGIFENQIMYFFVQEDGKGPEVVIERSSPDFSVGYNKSNLRSIVRDLPENPKTAKEDK